jgi:CBS domain-containing protein
MDSLLTAADIMVRHVLTLQPEAGVLGAVRRMLDNRITGAPVVDAAGGYLGIFSEKCAMDSLLHAAPLYQGRRAIPQLRARDIMQTNLLRLTPEMDAIAAIDLLLLHRISGAPVVDGSGAFLGIFSEKTSMSVLLGAAYYGLPDGSVEAFMDSDPGRVITDEELDLLEIAKVFVETPYRRLLVLRDGRVAGLIGRRDVLGAALKLARDYPGYLEALADGRGYSVGAAMDCHARTVPPEVDILRIAMIFQETPYRRLPVVEGPMLKGLVSRRDLLAGTRGILNPKVSRREASMLYLSAINDAPPPDVRG